MKDQNLNPWDELNRQKLSQMALRKIERAKSPHKQPSLSLAPRSQRLPPGQELTGKFPVLDLGDQPNLSTNDWSLSIQGCVEHPISWDWNEFQGLKRNQVQCDIHCVTNWSRFDNLFEGVSTQTIANHVKPTSEAKFVLLRSYDGYSTNLPLKDFLSEYALIADRWNGEPLSREHGGPVRFMLPHLYFWKSAKWIRQIVFRKDDHPGFWEVRGYHNYGDPWKNQRFK
ncbi:sulfite oxidase-like oxidoreductase [Terasakiella sp. A23]|uniref:sulfite oxidase-like oxidoreductase n=1 Tax=Terasakiella sp. FCG-A23 TaxID=3080561 RepID=UPI00295487DD|nr:sulfite oxidase-like oxidoreductase [Terasakiella sp. A23]MDV7341453.1 sulfite oxidase-like oxidoreductase [Terasakiella sp. A23]